MAGNENKNAPNVEQTAPSNTSEASEVPPIAGNENENTLNPDQTTPSNNGNATKEPYDPVKELAEIPYEFGEYGGVHKPIEVSATFTVSKPEDISRMFKGELGPDRHFLYSRHYNPTVMNLSRQMAKIENTEDAYCVSSGMAAISCLLIQICQSGGHVVAAKCLYGGTHALLTHFLPKACGITTTFVDVNTMENVKAAIKEETKVIFVESISNPTLTVANIPELAKVAHERRLKLVVDNTFAPMVLTPARHGADVVVHSLSKYVCGGADSIAGAVCGSAELVKSMMDLHKGSLMLLGPTMNAKVAFEISERLPHLGIRMKEHCRRALIYAQRMQAGGLKVLYPGLMDHPQHQLLKLMMNSDYGFGGVLCVDMGDEASANTLMNSLQYNQFGLMAVSLGYSETLMTCSGSSTSSVMTDQEKKEAGISDGLVRMSIGYSGTLEQRWIQFENAYHEMRKDQT